MWKEKGNKTDQCTDTLITHTHTHTHAPTLAHTRTATNAHLVLNDDLWGPWLKHFYDGSLTIIRPKLFPLRGQTPLSHRAEVAESGRAPHSPLCHLLPSCVSLSLSRSLDASPAVNV